MEKGYPKDYKNSELTSNGHFIAAPRFFCNFSLENSVEYKVCASHFSFPWGTGLHPKLQKVKRKTDALFCRLCLRT